MGLFAKRSIEWQPERNVTYFTIKQDFAENFIFNGQPQLCIDLSGFSHWDECAFRELHDSHILKEKFEVLQVLLSH